MSSQYQNNEMIIDKERIGRVSVENFKGSYRLRWYLHGTPYVITVGKASEETYKVAVAKAQEITSDITMERLDTTLAKYSPKHARKLAIANRPINLLDIINEYQKTSKDRVSVLVQKNTWVPFGRFIEETSDNKVFELSNPNDLIGALRDKYSVSYVETILKSLVFPAVNQAVKQKKITENPYLTIPLPKQPKRKIDCYSDEELALIFNKLEGSRYYLFCRLVALTGARPSEVIPLKTSDIKNNFILFNKSYTDVGGIKPTTKTLIDRCFPINNGIQTVLDNVKPKNGLLFPNRDGSYASSNNIRKRYWYPVIQNLIVRGELDRKLRLYSLRHSFATRMIRGGARVDVVARLLGNSPKKIYENYLKTDDNLTVPEVMF